MSADIDTPLDHATILALMRAQPRAMLGVCLGYAQQGDGSMIEALLEIGRKEEIEVAGKPLWDNTHLLSALLKSGCARRDLVCEWLENRAKMLPALLGADDLNPANRENALVVATFDQQMELAEFMVEEGADPCAQVALSGTKHMNLPNGSVVAPWSEREPIQAASALAVTTLHDPLGANRWMGRLLGARGDALLTEVPFGIQSIKGQELAMLRLCTLSPQGAGRVATLLGYCDPESVEIGNAVIGEFEHLTRDLTYLALEGETAGMLAELLSFSLDMPGGLGLTQEGVDRIKYYQQSTVGNLVHALVDCGREVAAGRALLAMKAAGIDIAARDTKGSTALHMAAEAGSAGLVQTLLEAGLSTKARNDEGLTPELSAYRAKQMETVAMLHAHDARAAIFSTLPGPTRNRPGAS